MRRLFPVILLTLAAGPAYADPTALSGVLDQSASTTPAERMTFAGDAVKEIGGDVEAVKNLIANEENRKDRREEVLDCLRRRLKPLEEMLAAATDSRDALTAAVSTGDTVSDPRRYREVVVALDKARDFYTEALACVPKSGADDGENEVSLDDTNLGDEPPLVDDVPVDIDPGSPN